MRFSLLYSCCFTLALVGSHAVTPEVYWKHMLPDTPMPKAIKESLPEWNDGKGTGVGGGRHKEKPDALGDPFRPHNYYAPASKDQLKDNPNVVLFFLENNLHQGAEMNLHFTKNGQKAMFLPRKIADSIPLSSNNLLQIYNYFFIKPDSMEAEDMKQMLNDCEIKGNEGEETYCATSLESMIDFTTTNLGQKVKAISTKVIAKENTPLQKYKIELAEKLSENNATVCHKQNYTYALFFCHKIVSTRAYVVSMVGADGVKVSAVAICHMDTAKWNPKNLASQVLKVKPGVPICHFLPEDHVAWIPY